MAFISNEKRKSLIKETHSKYGFKKFLLLVEIVGLIAFIVTLFVCEHYDIKLFKGDDAKVQELTNYGIGMLVYAVILAVLGVVSCVLIFTMKSPKTITKQNRILEGSAISGQKIHRIKNTPNQIVKSRTTLKKKK